jgi:hypothetical protein
MKKCIIVDIDGTLAIRGDRSPYDWSRVSEDTINKAVRLIVNSYHEVNPDRDIFIFSGRDGNCFPDTEKWLHQNFVIFDHLYLRPEKNQEKDSIIKERMFNDHILGKYEVDFVLDDRDQVVKLWRSLGLTCLQVDYGNF